MKITKEDRCCFNCKFWNTFTGYCKKHNGYTHGMDNICDKWKKHEDFIEHKPRKKKLENLNLFDLAKEVLK